MSAPQLIERSHPNGPQLSESQDLLEITQSAGSDHPQHEHGFEWTEIIRIAFVVFAAAAVWFRLWEPFPRISVIGIAATLIGGYPIFKEAFENIIERKNDDRTLDDHCSPFRLGNR